MKVACNARRSSARLTCVLQEASLSAFADAEVDRNLLRQLLQSAAEEKASHNFDVSEVRDACHICSKVGPVMPQRQHCCAIG